MRIDFLNEAIANIDFEIVDEAENYRPERKKHAWIPASAACLLIAGVLVFPRFIDVSNNNAVSEGRVHFASTSNGENSDHSEIDKTISVSITDELQNMMEDFKNSPNYKFYVRVYDANGAHSEVVWDECLKPLGLPSSDKEKFLQIGVASLTKAQINAVKGAPQLDVVMDYGGEVTITEEYLKTVNGPLNVWVFTNSGIDEALVGHEGEERIEFCEKYIDEFFSEYEKDHGLNRKDFKYFGIFTGTFRAELDRGKVKELLDDERSGLISISPETENLVVEDY